MEERIETRFVIVDFALTAQDKTTYSELLTPQAAVCLSLQLRLLLSISPISLLSLSLSWLWSWLQNTYLHNQIIQQVNRIEKIKCILERSNLVVAHV